MKQATLVARLVFGAWMLANGANHFFLSAWAGPVGQEPLAIQLMAALVHSHLFDVAMAIQLVAGALILAGVFVPVALCVVMPVSTCALFWALILDRQPLGAFVAFAAFALNGLLMLAYLDYYRDALRRHAPTLGEAAGGPLFESLFVNAGGRTPRAHFVLGLLTLLAVVAFYLYFVAGRTGQWSLLVLVFPGVILHARRLHDMGHTAWLLAVPTVLMVAAFAIRLNLVDFGTRLDAAVPVTALVVATAFALWCCIGRGEAAANRYGAPVPA
jgi:uncharacterized membrane protein YhaH (DUF805 family)